MLKPSFVLTHLVTTLQSIPEFVEAMQLASNIRAYEHSYPTKTSALMEFLDPNNAPPSALVVYDGWGWNRHKMPRHDLCVLLRSTGPGEDLIYAIREGVPTNISGGRKFKHANTADLYLPDIHGFRRKTYLVADNAEIEYHEVSLSYEEKGLDN